MTSIFQEPGFWVLVALPAFGLVQLVSTLLARRVERKLIATAEELRLAPGFNGADRQWLGLLLEDSTDPVDLSSVVAVPWRAAKALWETIPILWKSRGDDADSVVDALSRDTHDRKVERVQRIRRVDPRHGAYWLDGRRQRAEQLAAFVTMLRQPFITLWVGLFALPLLMVALPFLVAAHARNVLAEFITSALFVLTESPNSTRA